MKKNVITALIVLMFVGGIGLLLYPTFSDYWNSMNQARMIVDYVGSITDMDDERYEELWNNARSYNEKIRENGINWVLSDEDKKEYEQYLKVDSTGIMGYIDIPVLDGSFPIYHGTEENVLQVGIGHLEGSSLPVGGEGSHCVLSGHRGLPSARLFTDLDKMVEGDVFLIHTLDETLTYQVDQIRIVEPTDFSYLRIEDGQDYCTLVTCTPYGINSHRLLIRGHRVKTQEEANRVRVSADATMKDPHQVAVVVAIPLLVVVFAVQFVRRKRMKNRVNS